MKKALYFYVSRSSFVKKDIEIFSGHFKVEEFDFELKRKSGIFIRFLQQVFFLIKHIRKANVILCQFAGYHSFLPALFGKLTRKKVLIVAGGMDTVSFPSIGYGNFNKPVLKNFTALSYRLSSLILPKHESLWHCDYSYDKNNPSEQGITAFVKNLKVPHFSIPNGYDRNAFRRVSDKKPKTFLTVTGAMQYPFQKYLKGIDLILEVAKDFPDCTFTIVGAKDAKLPSIPTPNVHLLGKVANQDLVSTYSENQFYFQLSMAEGFPNALCEAMLCECVPIASAVFSIPEIIDDCGFLLPERKIELLRELMNSALKSDVNGLGKKSREKIISNYPLERRRELFRQIFYKEGLISARD